ncbi:unnamed protein product [Ambrosiozyma monospora]|uniref:Unnamed protein product n=2 Tax=Ambrosiozyma monospora TaxID=43982 RepID=A0ACB5UDR7_AMBMO|nr:unnamed protein product [Ambrosiozyma monospora]GMF08865.1 unnamed protein product [Ambrosiozyma monospora]
MTSPLNLAAWKQLQAIYDDYGKSFSTKDAFAKDDSRFEKFSTTFENYDGSKILFDFSKNLIDEKILSTLVELAKEAKLFTTLP